MYGVHLLIEVEPGRKPQSNVNEMRNEKKEVKTMKMNKEQAMLTNLVEEVGAFNRGAKYRATVMTVRKEGVAVAMPGGKGSGTVSACCWGKGDCREAALAKLAKGDELEVVVKSYDRRAQNLSLVLANCEHLLRGEAKPFDTKQRMPDKKSAARSPKMRGSMVMPIDTPKKPNYRLIPNGTTILVDTANVLGIMGPQHAAHRLSAIESALSERGHKAVFFIENRALGWVRCRQESCEEADALEAFCSRPNVSKVGDEADLPILQIASALSDSVILTRDHYEEYREVFPEIVGSDRLCTCSSVTVGDKTLFSIVGLRDAIVIDESQSCVQETVVGEMSETALDETENEVMAEIEESADSEMPPAEVPPIRKGLLGVGDVLRKKGNFARALACYGRIAKKVPAAYYDIAAIYDDAGSGWGDVRVSQKYQRLGQKSERKIRQCKLRRARLRAEGRRTGRHVRGLMRAA